jgi:hypothetical protein
VGLPKAYEIHCEAKWSYRGLMIYNVRQSGTARGLCLRCPVGLPGAYDVLCEAQFDYFKSMIGYVCETQWDYCRIMIDC